MSSDQSFQLPDLLNIVKPLQLRTNHHCRLVTNASERWFTCTLKEQGDCELTETELSYLRPMKAGLLCSLCFPTCDAPQLRILTDLTTLLLYSGFREYNFSKTSRRFSWNFKSSLSKAGSSNMFKTEGSGIEMLEGHALLKHVVHQCTSNITSKTPETWPDRFSESVRSFRDAQEKVISQKSQNIVPSVDDFITMRRDMNGAGLVFDMAELLEIFEYPELQGPNAEKILTLKRYALDVMVWSMDVVSYQFDQKRGKTHNLIAVLMSQKNLSLQGAMNLSGNMIKEALSAFLAAKQSILESLDPQRSSNRPILSWLWGLFKTDPTPLSAEEARIMRTKVLKYIQALEDGMIGIINWSYETELFFGKKGAEIRTFGWVFVNEVPVMES